VKAVVMNEDEKI